MATIAVVAGTKAGFDVQGTTDGLSAAEGYQSADALSCRVYAGRDQPTLFAPTCSWVDPSSCLAKITFTAAMTAALEPETYEIELDVIPSGTTDPIAIWKGFVEVQGGPGSAGTLRTPYCSAYHLRKWAPADLDGMQRDEDLAGFLEFRADATDWLDEIILNRYYPNLYFLDQKTAAQASFYGSVTYGQDPNLKAWLLQGKLLLRKTVVECVARKAIGEIYARAMTSDKKANAYAGVANRNLGLADDLAKSLRAEVDINGDGIGELIIDCGSVSIMRQ